jgi:hypothetical protein
MSVVNPKTGNDAGTSWRSKERIVLGSIYIAVFALARFWLYQVAKHVPEPYLVRISRAFIFHSTNEETVQE